MGRKPCCLKEEVNRGAWSFQEDQILTTYIQLHGEGKWRTLPQKAGLNRCGKSCRLRWMNYLRPGIKRGNISPEEEDLIIRLHRLLGNRWSLIAGRLPGRTDNEIKNYWNSVLSKKLYGEASNSKPSDNKQRQCEGNKESVENHKTDDIPKVIAPKATRCTKILISLDKGNDHAMKNPCPPSIPADNDDEFTSESTKDEVQMPNIPEDDEPSTDNVLNMPNALDYLDFSRTWLEDIFESCNMPESDLAQLSEMEFENLTSSLALENEWSSSLQ